jgi:hypothetical protein
MLTVMLLTASSFVFAQDDYAPPQNYTQPPPPNNNYRNPRNRRTQKQQPEQVVSGKPSGYVSLNFGAANPMGNFGNVSGTTGYGNYAQAGNMYNLSAGIPLNHSNFGIALMLGQCYNPFDLNSYMSNFVNSSSVQATLAPATLNSSTGTYGPNPNYSSPGYSETHFMAGLFYTYPMRRFSFDLRGLIGVMACSLPSVSVLIGPATAGDISDEFDIIPNQSSVSAFAYDLGGGIRYLLPIRRRSTCLMLDADILQASTKYNVTDTHTQYNPPLNTYNGTGTITSVTTSNISGTQPISLVTISIGIGIQFDTK